MRSDPLHKDNTKWRCREENITYLSIPSIALKRKTGVQGTKKGGILGIQRLPIPPYLSGDSLHAIQQFSQEELVCHNTNKIPKGPLIVMSL